jgi:hypothetical protein
MRTVWADLGVAALRATLVLGAAAASPAQSTVDAPVSVPFVGCASLGQVGALEAPTGTSRTAPIRAEDARVLAYYRSADGIGLVAPRGWYCEGTRGSDGAALFLSPKPIGHGPSGYDGLEGAGIELRLITREASGWYDFAVIAQLFPAYKSQALRTMEERGVDQPNPLRSSKDRLRYVGKTIVEYETPARTEGLGNFDSWLGKNDMPIRGVAIVIFGSPNLGGDPPNLLLLSVRVPEDLAKLVPTIVLEVERQAAADARR